MNRARRLARAAAEGAVIGAVVGLSFAYLELVVGCGVAGAFPAVEGRLPAPDVALLVTLADVGLGAVLGTGSRSGACSRSPGSS